MTAKTTTSIRVILRWWWRAIKPVRWAMCAVGIAGILRVACTLAFVWVSRSLIDTAVSSYAATPIMWMSIGLSALMIAQAGFGLVGQYISGKAEIKLKNGMRRGLFGRILESCWL